MRTNRHQNDWLALSVALNLFVGGLACAADAPSSPSDEQAAPVRHARLGCSPAQADALYGEAHHVGKPKETFTEQRFYNSPDGTVVEMWFDERGASGIFLQKGNGLEVIHQVLSDSADGGTWRLDGRVWRRSDGKAIAVVMRGTLFVTSNPSLSKNFEDQAAKEK